MPADPVRRRERILRRAYAEMSHAADEYDEATPGLGDEFLATVERAFGRILSAPHRWPRVDDRHHRYVVRRFPFSVIYRYNETELVFVAVAHHRRRPEDWMGRR